MSSSFPRKEDRNRCYAARDQYWNCLDQHDMEKDENAAIESCKKFKGLFEANCPQQWVTHFNRKYKYLKFKEKIDSGYDPINESKNN